jgi:hypothetical protein
MPTQSLEHAASASRAIPPEPNVEASDPARAAGVAAAAATFGAGAGAAVVAAQSYGGGKRALVQYDYEKAEDNELELREGEYVTNIEMVDDDWWTGQNSQGEIGLFPSNYVELVEDDAEEEQPPPMPMRVEPEAPAPPTGPPHAGGGKGPTATALYDYEAAEDNELSFPDGATITDVVSVTLSFRSP